MTLTRHQKLTIVRDAVALLRKPGGWVKQSFMQPMTDSDDLSFCAVGAINFASWQLGHRQAQLKTRVITEALGLDDYCREITGHDLIELNDHVLTEREVVIELLTDFIEVLEESILRKRRHAVLLGAA